MRSATQGQLLAIAACALWGFAFVGPVMLAEVPPTVIAAGRYLAYGLTSAAALALNGKLVQPRQVWAQAFVLSLFGMLFYFVALSAALHRAGVVLPTLIIGMLPVTIPLAACAVQRQRPSWLQGLGFALTLAGTWLARPAGNFGLGSEALAGAALATFSLLVWTAYALVNTRLLRQLRGITAQDWSALQGVACLPFVPPLMLMHTPATLVAIDWPKFLAISIILGVICSWAANSLWNAASTRLTAHQLGPLIVVEMLAGLVYGRIYTAEPWRAEVWIGAALLVLGVVIAVRGEPQKLGME